MNPFHTSNEIKQMLCLAEPGFYFFLGRSDKPKALPYQKWVTGEVIPAIRKIGEYRLPDAAPAQTSDDLINARIQVVTLRIMGGLSIYTPALRMKFLAEAASLMSGRPMSDYLPPEEGSIPEQWVAASGLARRFGLSNSEIGRLLKKRGFHGTQDEAREWSQPIGRAKFAGKPHARFGGRGELPSLPLSILISASFFLLILISFLYLLRA